MVKAGARLVKDVYSAKKILGLGLRSTDSSGLRVTRIVMGKGTGNK